MANGYFSTSLSNVFPSAYRVTNAEGKYTSEKNLTNIVKSICELDSFLINPDNNSWIEFILDGYYFKVQPSDGDWAGIPDNLWFCINVPPETKLLSHYENHTTILDDNNYFTGLKWYTDEPPVGAYTAKLQVRKDGMWINQGWIPALVDRYGNWINLHDFIEKLLGDSYYSSEGFKLDPSYIDINKFQQYLLDNGFSIKYAGKAKQLVQANGTGEGPDSFGDPYTIGGYDSTTKTTQTIKFEDGIPVNSIKIYYNDHGPDSPGNPGDIWFVYKG